MRYYWHTELPLEAFKHVGDRRIKPQGGGGGIVGDIVGGVTDAVSSVVGGAADVVADVANTVTDAAAKVVDGAAHVVSNAADTAVEAVDSVVASAKNDPLAFAADVALVATGNAWAIPYVNAANAAAHGASLEQVAETAAISYVAGQVGGAAASEAAGTGFEAAAAGAGAGATNAALRGGDIETGALAGALNSGLNSALNSAVNGPSFSSPSGGSDDANRPDNIDVGGGYNPADGALTNDNIDIGGGYNPATGTGALPSVNADAEAADNIDIGGGYNPATGMGDQDTADAAAATGLTSSAYDAYGMPSSITLPKINFAAAMGIGSPTNQSIFGLSGAQPNKPTYQYGSPKLLNGDSLTGESTGDPLYLQQLKQLYSSLTPQMQQTLMTNNGNVSNPTGSTLASNAFEQQSPLYMASGGLTESSSTTDSVFPKAVTGLSRGPLVGGGQRKVMQLSPLTQLNPQMAVHRAKGGLTVSHPDIPKDHKPEFITGETGYYASGRGTGQSDDIPAVLRHGDYVMDADAVAALGDGSSKAGAEALEKFRQHIPASSKSGGKVIPAQIADGEFVFPEPFVTALGGGDNAKGAKMLDAMRKELREHKRSAPTSKIPPKAKSPLEYIKMGMKG